MGRFNVEAWNLANDFEVLLSLLRTLPEKSYRAVQLNMALNEAVSAYADDPANAAAARSCVAPQLAMRATDSALSTAAVGHAHIDTGWLWPVRETIRKCARTFSSQLYNLERYPDYVFGASQPQLYAFVKEHYPELYAKIREAVKSGRWELQGGMWVEADCNIISGESMVRQFLAGKNFYMDEFGMDVRNLWLPDVFGYSAAMPQIIRKAGCDWFLTQKISWSQFNKFPYHTFHWRGIDGTEVLTHFPPEDNYNSALKPEQLNYAVNNFNENYFLPEFITLFGVGDGGGGRAGAYRARFAHGGPRRVSAGPLRPGRCVFRPAGRTCRRAAGVGGRALSGASSRHADDAGADQAQQPQMRADARADRVHLFGAAGGRLSGRNA